MPRSGSHFKHQESAGATGRKVAKADWTWSFDVGKHNSAIATPWTWAAVAVLWIWKKAETNWEWWRRSWEATSTLCFSTCFTIASSTCKDNRFNHKLLQEVKQQWLQLERLSWRKDRAGDEVPEWWSFPELQGAPRGKDRWMTLRNKWLIRVHGEERRRVFQPIHRSCPVDGARLKSKRTSVVYPVDGRTERCIKHDQWTSSSWTMNYRWVGYTVFEIVNEEEIELTGTQQVPNQSSSSTTFSSTAAGGVEPPMPARNAAGYEGHSVVVNNQPVINVTVTVSGRDRPF